MAIEKKSKFWGPFWSYQLSSPANSAYSPCKWAELSVLFSWQLQKDPHNFDFSITMGADYSFELIYIVHWVPQFFMHNRSILSEVHWIKKDQKGSNRIKSDQVPMCRVLFNLYSCPRDLEFSHFSFFLFLLCLRKMWIFPAWSPFRLFRFLTTWNIPWYLVNIREASQI